LLQALKGDLERGFLDRLILRVQAEVTADYLGMAEGLLGDGPRGANDHVPAAVLSGAILERSLREACGRQNPAIPTLKPNGEPKAMSALIEDLKAAGVFHEVLAKQLRAWAGIRNAAAHGHFDEFTRDQVELMVKGIGQFLALQA